MFKVSKLVRFLAATVALAIGSSAAQAAPLLVAGTTSTTETVKYGGLTRTVMYVKSTTASTTKVPMMVMLHFGGGTGEKMETLTEISEVVRDNNILVMLPYGVNGKFNWDPSASTGVDDVGFISNRIADAVTNRNVNAKKVSITGYSNGGFMAMRYACEQASKVSAVAVVSTVFRNSWPCKLTTTVPLALIDGTADSIVAYNGATGLLSASATAQKFATNNGCTSGAIHSSLPDLVTTDNSQVTLDEYRNCTSGANVRLYSVIGGGHTWPDSPYNSSGLGAVNQDINGTLTVWEFVKTFSR